MALPEGFQVRNSISALDMLSKVKQREVACPIVKARALTTALMTIDDMTLKTTIASPDMYDVELTKLVHRHTSFPDLPNELNFNAFMDNISYIDRKMLIWGIFASTYNTLGKVDIICPYCDNKFSDEIKADDLLHADSVKVWDKPVPFNEYVFSFDYECNIDGLYKLEFDTSLPTINQHLAVMHLLNSDKLKDNFNKFGNIFSRVEDVTSILRAIKVYRSAEDTDPERFITPRDIHSVVTNSLTMDISDYILEKYGDEFDKYVPVFKKPFKCVQCGNDFDYIADPEASLFRQFFRRR